MSTYHASSSLGQSVDHSAQWQSVNQTFKVTLSKICADAQKYPENHAEWKYQVTTAVIKYEEGLTRQANPSSSPIRADIVMSQDVNSMASVPGARDCSDMLDNQTRNAIYAVDASHAAIDTWTQAKKMVDAVSQIEDLPWEPKQAIADTMDTAMTAVGASLAAMHTVTVH